jgi:hypothetical protein
LRFGIGVLSGVCFALSEMGVEGAGGGIYRQVALVVVLGVCGVVVLEQVLRGSRCDKMRGTMLLVVMVVGALQRGCGRVVCMDAGTRAGGARVSGGVDDPDVCGLWFQESLPLCMVITSSVLFFCLL